MPAALVMRRLLIGICALAALASASGCDNGACRGVDGTCVALTVTGAGQVDGIEIALSGAASGTKVAPPTARLQSLPVEIGVALPAAANGPLHLELTGLLAGSFVGSGAGDVNVSPGAHASVRIALGPGGSGGDDAGVVGPPVDVAGERVRHFVLGDGGVVDVPTDFTKNELDTLVDTGSGFSTTPATGDASGHFTVHTPSSPYYLRYGTSATYGSAANPSLDDWILGRADQTHALARTTLSFNVGNLTAWNSGDTLEFFALNAGTALFYVEGVLNPAANATTLAGSLDLSRAPFGMLIDGSKGDDAMLLQLVADSNAGIAYQRLAKLAQFARFTVADGGSQSLSANMSDVGSASSLSLMWARSQFAAAAAAINPSATDDYDLVDLFAQPGGIAHGFFSSQPDLILATPSSSSSDVALTLSYGNPFPASWPLVAAIGTNHSVAYTAAGATATAFDGSVFTYAAADQLPSPVVPLVSPVQSLRIDGQSATVAQAVASTTPRLSWSAPAMGTPSSYAVFAFAIDNALGVTSLDFAAALYTTATSVRLPPGLLVAGQSYFFVVRAFADSVDRSVTPFVSAVPSSWADALTASVAVRASSTVDGASCKAILAAHPGSPDGVYTVDGGGGAPFATFCDMTTDGGGWTLVGKIDGRATISSEWLTALVNPALLTDPTIVDNSFACADAVSFAVNAATEIRLANSARDRWVKWPLPSGRTTATWWHHAAGQTTINAAAQTSVTVKTSTGATANCFQNIYGILPFSAHGGSYPSTAGNTAGNTTPGDWCMSVGTVAPNMTVDGFMQNGNGWDAPTSESDWPNASYNVPAHVSVWLR